MAVIGFDTSNYTTSVAWFDGVQGVNCSKLLPVKQGELGLRQSDAVFAHMIGKHDHDRKGDRAAFAVKEGFRILDSFQYKQGKNKECGCKWRILRCGDRHDGEDGQEAVGGSQQNGGCF